MTRARADLMQRLSWLYGDPEHRIEANQADVQKWRHIGGKPYAKPWSPSGAFARGVLAIAKAALT